MRTNSSLLELLSRRPTLTRAFVLSATGVFVLAPQAAFAATATWSGASDGTWATPANWTASTVPGASDSALFLDAGNGHATINAGALSLLNLTLDNASGTLAAYTFNGTGLTLGAGGAITANANVTNTQTYNVPVVLSGNASFANNGTGNLLFTGGLSGGTSGGILSIAGSGAVTLNNCSYTALAGQGIQVAGGNLIVGGSSALSLSPVFASITSVKSSGTWTLKDTASLSFTGGDTRFFVGNGSAGTLNVNNSSALNCGQFCTGVGGGAGTVNQNGGTITATGGIFTGDGNSASTYNLNGGTLVFTGGFTNNGNTQFVFNFNGGTLQAASSYSVSTSNTNSFVIKSGGAIVNTNGQTMTFNQALLGGGGGGGLTKNGSGQLTLGGTAVSTYTGATNVNAGTLYITGTGGPGSGAVNLAAGTALTFDATSVFNGACPIVLGTGASDVNFNVNGSASVTTGGISGGNPANWQTFYKNQPGTWTMKNGGTNTLGACEKFTVAGGAVVMDNTSLTVPYAATWDHLLYGTPSTTSLTLKNGSAFTAYDPLLADDGNGGTLNIYDTSTFTATSNLEVGRNGTATLNQFGGTVNANWLNFNNSSVTGKTDRYNLAAGKLVLSNNIGAYNSGSNANIFNLGGGTMEWTTSQSFSNLFTGGSSGMFVFASGNALGTGTATGGAVIQVDAGKTVTFAQVLANGNGGVDGGLTVTGSGTLILTAANTDTGGTFINNGVLQINGDTALGASSGAVSFGSGSTATLQAGANGIALNASRTITLASGTGIIDTQSYGMTVNGSIGGFGALAKIGSGSLTLSASDSYTGGTTITTGTLAVANNSALGSGTVTLNGGVLATSGGSLVTVANAVQLTTSSGIGLTGGDLTLNGALTSSTNSVLLTKSGSGTLTLASSSGYSGQILLNNGTVIAHTANNYVQLGYNPESGATTAAFLLASPGDTDANRIFFRTQSGLKDIAGGLNSSGTVSLTGFQHSFNGSTAYYTAAAGGQVNVGTIIADSTNAIGNVVKIGAGTVRFSGQGAGSAQPSYLGTLTIEAGTLLSSSDDGGTTIASGTLANGATAWYGGPLGYTPYATIVNLGDAGTQTTDNLALLADGGSSGTPRLIGHNLSINAQNSAGTTALGANTGSYALYTGTISLNRGLQLTSGSGAIATFSGPIVDANGSNAVTVTGSGTVVLSGSNSFGGGVNLSAGQLNVNAAYALGTGTLTFSGGTLNNSSGAAIVNAANNPQVWSNFVLVNGTNSTNDLNLGTGPVTMIGTTVASIPYYTTLTVGGSISGSAAGISKYGVGTLALTGSNNFSGGVSVNGGSLTIGNDYALGSGTLTINAGTLGLATAGGARVLSNAVSLNASCPVTTANGDLTLNGPLTSSTNTNYLTKSGTGTLTLSGSLNNFNAGIYVNNGTVISHALPSGANAWGVVLANSAEAGATQAQFLLSTAGETSSHRVQMLVQSGVQVVVGGVNTSGTVSYGDWWNPANGSTIYVTAAAGGQVNVQNMIGSSNANLIKIGSGTVRFGYDGANNSDRAYSGNMTIRAGTFLAGADDYGISGSGSAIANGNTSNGGGGPLGFSAYTQTVNLGDAGTQTTDNLALLADGGSSGTPRLIGHNLSINGQNSAGTTMLGANTGSYALFTGMISLNRGVQLTAASGCTSTFSAPIVDASGTNAVTVTGSGTVVLNGANTYAGSTTVNGGILNLGNSDALAGGGNVTFTGGTLQFSGSNTNDYSARIVASTGAISLDTNGQSVAFASSLPSSNVGGLVKLGTGSLTLGGSNSYVGGTTITSGTLAVANDNALGSGTATINGGALATSGGTLRTLANAVRVTAASTAAMTDGDLTITGALTSSTSSATLTKSGSGTLTIAGSTTGFSAEISVNNGTVYSHKFSNSIWLGGSAEAGATLARFLLTSPGDSLSGRIFVATQTGLQTIVGGANTSGTASFNNFNDSVGNGTAYLTAAAGGQVNMANTFVDGAAIGVTKIGPGTVRVAGAGAGVGSKSYSGNTSVWQGTLLLANNDLGTIANSGSGTALTAGGVTYVTAGNNVGQGGDLGYNDWSNAIQLGGTSATAIGSTQPTDNIGLLTAGQYFVGHDISVNAYNSSGVTSLGISTSGTGQACFAGNIALNRSVQLTAPTSGTAVFAGVISDASGSNAVTKTGSGTVILAGVNTYSGGTTVNSGTLNLASDAALGAVSGAVTLNNGGTLQTSGSIAFDASRNFVVSSGTATIDTQGNTDTVNGALSGAGVLAKSGTGTLILAGSVQMAGLNANSGVTQLAQSGSIGALSVASGATFSMAANTTGARTVLNLSSLSIGGTAFALAAAPAQLHADTLGGGASTALLASAAQSALEPAAPEAVPEPGALGLLLAGASALLGFRRKAKRSDR